MKIFVRIGILVISILFLVVLTAFSNNYTSGLLSSHSMIDEEPDEITIITDGFCNYEEFNDFNIFYTNEGIIYDNEMIKLLFELDNIPYPSKPHCSGFPMTLDTVMIAWININETNHAEISVYAWKCLRQNCKGIVTVDGTSVLKPHNYFMFSHWHNTNNTHTANERCSNCNRVRTQTYKCLSNPCLTPMKTLLYDH